MRSGDLAAAIGWWRDAGVDLQFSDDPRDWLGKADAAAPPPPAAMTAPPPPPEPEPERIEGLADMPADLPAFTRWWLEEPSLDHGMVERRVPPRGPVGAALMVLVPQPESADTDRLLSGPEGTLLSAILAALGLAEDQVYLATCLPRHTPLPDWAALHAAGLGQVLAHHIALAAPQRLLLMGGNISSLLGHDPTKIADPFAQFNHDTAICPVLTAPGLDNLGARSRRKAQLWQALLDWTG